MRPPFSYYGGKQNLVSELLPLIPQHIQYAEVFCGGAALYWAKKPSKNEVLNDLNGNLTNFYMQLKTNFTELQKMIHGTLHSEVLHKETHKIIDEPEKHNNLIRAWAWWVQCNMSFSFICQGGFAFGTTGMALGSKNKRDRFTDRLCKRIETTEIFCRKAEELIDLKDHRDTLFFVDPPYVSSNQGHYSGYTESDFINLLNLLQNIKGKFILTSYPETTLMKYREMCSVENIGVEKGWRTKDIEQIVSVTGKREETKFKTECITYNFAPPNEQKDMFADMAYIETINTEDEKD